MASSNRIGANPGDACASAQGNLISANQGFGVWIWQGASSNVVAGNFIGTDVSGTVALANSVGVLVSDAPKTTGSESIRSSAPRTPTSETSSPGTPEPASRSRTPARPATRSPAIVSGPMSAAHAHWERGRRHLDRVGRQRQHDRRNRAGGGNLISGNDATAWKSTTQRQPRPGNMIGLDQTGTLALGNTRGGRADRQRFRHPTRSAGPAGGRATSSPGTRKEC